MNQTRLAKLLARIPEAQITVAEVETFHKVATIIDDGRGRSEGDGLIAASFLAGQNIEEFDPAYNHAAKARVRGVVAVIPHRLAD